MVISRFTFGKNLNELTDNTEPGDTASSIRSQVTVRHYQLLAPTVSDLQSIEPFFLGDCIYANTSATDCRLSRTIPISDPIHPDRYASEVSVKGVGSPSRVTSFQRQPGLASSYPGTFSLYPDYSIKASFTPRLYPVMFDSGVTNYVAGAAPGSLGSWVDFTGATKNFSFCNEWVRYTDFDEEERDDWLEATGGGQMIFQTTGASPNGQVFAQMSRVRLPNRLLKVMWFMVPYRYITSPNSYIVNSVGWINQNAWWNWAAGQLLYIGWKVNRYQLPAPGLAPVVGTNQKAYSKFCDIELDFILTTRKSTDTIPVPTNKNFVTVGHNLLPWLVDRKFHYAITTGANSVPFWYSFPAEILFSDPDVPNAGVAALATGP